MKKSLSQLVEEFEKQITNVEFRTNPKLRTKLEKLKTLVGKFELSRKQEKTMKGLTVEYK